MVRLAGRGCVLRRRLGVRLLKRSLVVREMSSNILPACRSPEVYLLDSNNLLVNSSATLAFLGVLWLNVSVHSGAERSLL